MAARLTGWMRRGFAPIAATARMELHYPEPDVAPPEALDVDAAFQLVLPLLWLPPEVSGTCRLDVRIPGEGDFAVGAMAEVAGDLTLVHWLVVALHEILFRDTAPG